MRAVQARPEQNAKVSIIVPARNEARNLEVVLPTLPADAEIIVVDGHSKDDTTQRQRCLPILTMMWAGNQDQRLERRKIPPDRHLRSRTVILGAQFGRYRRSRYRRLRPPAESASTDTSAPCSPRDPPRRRSPWEAPTL